MSRRDKQADLRRRMADARSKLASSKSNTHEPDEGPGTATAAAGKKRPLPPSASGILRKSKYTSANKSVDKEEDADGGGSNNNVLGSLMAGYDDSSSDDEGGKSTPAAVGVANKQKGTPVGNALETNNSGDNAKTNQKQKSARWSSQFEERTIIEDAAGNVPPRGNGMETITHELPNGSKKTETEIKRKDPKKDGNAPKIADDIWDEFNALLDDDEAETAKDAASATLTNDEPSMPEAEAEPLAEEAPVIKPAKKKSKKKKKKAPPKDMYDNEAMVNVEQASYEGRLARLMLLKSKKTRGKNNGSNVTQLPSTEEFYDPGLAFQQEDEEDDDGQEVREEDANDTANLKSDEDGETSPATSGAAHDPPRVSLANILRDRRDQARHLSSGGNDANVDDDEIETDCWDW